MKPLILALLLLLPLGVAARQGGVIREYDRFENRTRYWTPPARMVYGLDLRVTFSFRGKGAGNDIEGFHLVFSSTSSDWRYLKDSHLYLLIDGKSVSLGQPKARDNDVQTGYSSVQVKEVLAFPIKYQTLQKLTAAKNVEMRLGSTEFSLPQYAIKDIKDLLGKVRVVSH